MVYYHVACCEPTRDTNRLFFFSLHQAIFELHGVITMRISYDKLWKLLIDNKLKKGELFKAAKLTATARRNLNHDEPVDMKYLMNICKIFHCNIGDVVDFIEED